MGVLLLKPILEFWREVLVVLVVGDSWEVLLVLLVLDLDLLCWFLELILLQHPLQVCSRFRQLSLPSLTSCLAKELLLIDELPFLTGFPTNSDFVLNAIFLSFHQDISLRKPNLNKNKRNNHISHRE